MVQGRPSTAPGTRPFLRRRGGPRRKRFPECFATAVARCLGVGRAGIWLSGGLDSVSVAAFCAEHVNQQGLHPPVALCLRFPDPETDEEQVQRAVARQLRFEAVVLGLEESVAPKSLVGAMRELSAGSPAPVLNLWLPAYLALSEEARRRGCETILTGAGGDEWLCVTPLLAADLLAAGDLGGVLRLAQAAKASFAMSSWQVARSYLWRFGARPLIARRLLPGLAPRALQHRDRWRVDRSTPEWLAPDPALRRSLGDRRAVRSAPARFYDDELLQGLDHPLVAMEFEQLHEVGRRLGMPVQSPFFDVDLVELLCRVHPDTLNQGGRSKGLVRSTLDRRFPDLAFGSQKKVSAGQTLDRLLAPAGPDSWQLGPDSALIRLGVIDRNAFQAASRSTMADGSRRDRWAVLQVKAIDAFATARW
jgi:asparagine synthetase B (glutamine-hydrolysing)